VRSDCIPFSAIPHSSHLFLDFLSHSSKVEAFFPQGTHTSSVFEEAKTLIFDDARRKRVADVLQRQNRSWLAGEATFRNIDRLRNGAVAVVSGQQVGLFGGPLYSVLKAVSAIRLAHDIAAQGVEAIPVFWLATEDHDLAEVNNALLPVSGGGVRRFTSTSAGASTAPVAHIEFGAEIEELVAEACAVLGESEAAEALRASYRAGENYGSAFAKLFARLFKEQGLVLMDPIDAEWHEIATPVFLKAAERAAELDEALLTRGTQLRSAGYHEQVKVTGESTLLFAFEDGGRTVVHRANGDFMIGNTRVAKEDLLRHISEHPERFSPNVLLRPIMQDFLLPTVTYFGGPAEIAYFAQAAVVYQEVIGRVTHIRPRLSATLVDGRMQRLLNRYSLFLPDLFHVGDHLPELLASKVLPGELSAEFEKAERGLADSLAALRNSVEKLDKTLVDALDRSARKMQYQLGKIKTKAARAELRKSEQLTSDAREISTLLFPEKNLQERELAGIYFLAKHGLSLIDELIAAAGTQCPGHQVYFL